MIYRVYSFVVNTINIFIECNENISIFTSANVFITRDENFMVFTEKRVKFLFLLLFTRQCALLKSYLTSQQNMNVMASTFIA